jgi:magnesium chelatase accessory protein
MNREMDNTGLGGTPFSPLRLTSPPPRMLWDRDGRDWPNRGSSRFVSAASLVWHVQIMGRGPALLMLHGTGASTHSWRELAPLLARHFTVIAPDLPGHAFTQAPAAGRYSIAAFSSAVAALLDVLKARPAMAVGHSAGAAILTRMNLDGHLSDCSVVSINGAFLPLPGLSGVVFSPMAKLLARIPQVPGLFARHASNSPMVERLLSETGSVLDNDGAGFYARLARNPAHVGAALSMMAGWNLALLGPALPRVSVPMLLAAADNDRTIPPRQARDLAGRIPRARFARLAGLGHLAHEEAPRLVAALVLRWARRQRAWQAHSAISKGHAR